MKRLPKSILKELRTLANWPDSEIDDSDIPVTKREDWADAVRGKFFKPQNAGKPRRG